MGGRELETGIFWYMDSGQESLPEASVKALQVLCLSGVYVSALVSVDGWRGGVCCRWASGQLSALVEVHRCECCN